MTLLKAVDESQMDHLISAFGTSARGVRDWAGTLSMGALMLSSPQAPHIAEEQWLHILFVVLQWLNICCVLLAPSLRDFGNLINLLCAGTE